MGRELYQKQIGEKVYTVNQFGAIKANKILYKLKKFLGPALMEVMTMDPDSKDQSSQAAKMGAAIEAIGGEMSEEDFSALCTELLSECFVGNVSVNQVINDCFMGELQDMYTLMFEVIKVNYSGFLKSLIALKTMRAAMKAKAS